MFFALEHSPTLFEAPPLALADILPLIIRTLGLALGVSLGALILGTSLAFVHVRYDYFGNRWLSLLSTLPLAVPSYLLAAMVRESLAPRGGLGSLLGTESAFTGFNPAVLVLILSCTPYVQILSPLPCNKTLQVPMKRREPSAEHPGVVLSLSHCHDCDPLGLLLW